MIIEDFSFETPKTKAFIAMSESLKVAGKKILLVLGESDHNVSLSARNLKNIKIIPVANLNTYDVMNAGIVLMAESSINVINETLA